MGPAQLEGPRRVTGVNSGRYWSTDVGLLVLSVAALDG